MDAVGRKGVKIIDEGVTPVPMSVINFEEAPAIARPGTHFDCATHGTKLSH
jgi:hypothetical protein